MARWTPTEDWQFRISHWPREIIRQLVEQQVPELRGDLPGQLFAHGRTKKDEEILILVWRQGSHLSFHVSGDLDEAEFCTLKSICDPSMPYGELRGIHFLDKYFSKDSFLWIAPIQDGDIITDSIDNHIVDWLNEFSLPNAVALNEARVRRAIPSPPTFDIQTIAENCWVLESYEACAQGTAFRLEGVGFVTCHHVLHSTVGAPLTDVTLHHASDVARKYPIRLKISNEVLDLAIFDADVPKRFPVGLKISENNDVPVQSHVAVCGFPNYRDGDTCTLSPGVVVAHRTARGGIRRLLTNAGIIAGMSGGPAIASGRDVIGVLVTGAPWMQDARNTEDQAIIPITALDLLNPASA